MNRYNYAKLIDGELQYPPKSFVEDGKRIVGFTDNFLLERGYKRVTYDELPEDMETVEYRSEYVENEDTINGTWVLAEKN